MYNRVVIFLVLMAVHSYATVAGSRLPQAIRRQNSPPASTFCSTQCAPFQQATQTCIKNTIQNANVTKTPPKTCNCDSAVIAALPACFQCHFGADVAGAQKAITQFTSECSSQALASLSGALSATPMVSASASTGSVTSGTNMTQTGTVPQASNKPQSTQGTTANASASASTSESASGTAAGAGSSPSSSTGNPSGNGNGASSTGFSLLAATVISMMAATMISH